MTARPGTGQLVETRVGPAVRGEGSSGGIARSQALRLADDIQRFWGAREDTSHDPYDGLLARRVPPALKAHRSTRLALVHLHRRYPRNLRPLFGIPPTRSPYASAQLASACLRIAGATGAPEAEAAARRRLRWLARVRIRGGWAYPFDVQTRTFHYLRSTPNVVCTAFAANAFLDAAELRGDDEALAVAGEACRFAVQELLARREGVCWFRYLPVRDELIHNGNALAAQVLVRYGSLAGDQRMSDLGHDALQTTLAAIRLDGSLPYGREADLAWVDGHHTGFVIDALHTVARYGSHRHRQLEGALRRMTRYYRAHLFGPEGWPYQRPDTPYPLDVIAGAQGVQVFARLGGENRPMAETVAAFVLERMLLRSGRFAYARGRWHVKRVPYLRWTEAPLCLALAVLATEPSSAGGSGSTSPTART